MGSWSGMREYLERDVLAESLKGRVRWECREYTGTGGAAAFEVYVDDVPAKRFSMEMVAVAACGGKKPEGDMHSFWEAYWKQKDLPMDERSEFDDEDFALALAEYRCIGAREALESDDPVVRMFAVMDGNICRRTLEELACGVERQPEWLRPFYRLRLRAEGI